MSLTDSDADEIFSTDLIPQPLDRYVEPLNVTRIANTEGESDEPLFRVTIIRFTKLNSTLIGACHSHVLCALPSTSTAPTDVLTEMVSVDGAGALYVVRLMSQLYQGLGPTDPPPHYEPKAIKFPEPSKPPSPIYRLYELSAPPPWEQPERKAMEFVAFRLTTSQLTELHDSVTKGLKHLKITRVGLVIALLAQCLSEVEPESKPIDTISYVVNVRPFVASPATQLIFS